MTRNEVIKATIDGTEIWKQVETIWLAQRVDKKRTTQYKIKNHVEVSNLGRLRVSYKSSPEPRLLSDKTDKNRIRNKFAMIGTDYRPRVARHQLVLQTFFPEDVPTGVMLIDHIDRNPTNNSLTNLRWSSFKENSNNTSIHTSIECRTLIGELNAKIKHLEDVIENLTITKPT